MVDSKETVFFSRGNRGHRVLERREDGLIVLCHGPKIQFIIYLACWFLFAETPDSSVKGKSLTLVNTARLY